MNALIITAAERAEADWQATKSGRALSRSLAPRSGQPNGTASFVNGNYSEGAAVSGYLRNEPDVFGQIFNERTMSTQHLQREFFLLIETLAVDEFHGSPAGDGVIGPRSGAMEHDWICTINAKDGSHLPRADYVLALQIVLGASI